MSPDPHEVLDDWLRRTPFSESTRAAYRAEVRAWLAFVGERTWCAERTDVDTWSADGAKPRTKARRISSLRGFYHHAQTYDAFIDNPAARDLRPPVAHLPPGRPALTRPQAALFLSALDHYTGPLPHRTRALGHLILAMNLRAHQAVALDLDDWIRERHRTTARVQLKGGGSEIRAVPPPVALAVDDYLPHRRTALPHSSPDTGSLLTSNRGRRLDSHTTPTTLMRAVAATHPLLAEIAPTITCDGLAATPGPFRPG
ncbi:site-specific integrase [Streptomyces sp. NPDC127108]|uniref:site-specific integrase n=1 Tax=Streptomyces sp. NPDC127108 TaxID=3345361 RepID=UPI003631F3A5